MKCVLHIMLPSGPSVQWHLLIQWVFAWDTHVISAMWKHSWNLRMTVYSDTTVVYVVVLWFTAIPFLEMWRTDMQIYIGRFVSLWWVPDSILPLLFLNSFPFNSVKINYRAIIHIIVRFYLVSIEYFHKVIWFDFPYMLLRCLFK